MFDIHIDYKVVIATALLSAGAVWMVKKTAEKSIEKVAEYLEENGDKFNPVNDTNYINQGFQDLWTGVTGVNDSPGSWLYDILHPAPGPNPQPEYIDSWRQ